MWIKFTFWQMSLNASNSYNWKPLSNKRLNLSQNEWIASVMQCWLQQSTSLAIGLGLNLSEKFEHVVMLWFKFIITTSWSLLRAVVLLESEPSPNCYVYCTHNSLSSRSSMDLTPSIFPLPLTSLPFSKNYIHPSIHPLCCLSLYSHRGAGA